MTGFRIGGEMSRNDVINYPVQGSAFHVLLKAIIMSQDFLRGMKSKIVGQIHDSMVLDVHADELQDVLSKIYHIMCVELPKQWKWINVPLDAEVEVAPKGEAWHFKSEYIKVDGLWQKKPKKQKAA